MRSRDGNHYQTLAICTVILFHSLVLNASEFFISYRYVVKDATLYNESLQVARAMKKCKGTPHGTISLFSKDDDLKKTIEDNSEEFLDFIHKLGMEIKYSSNTTDAIHSSTSILTLKTTCFKVDFNDSFVKISALK